MALSTKTDNSSKTVTWVAGLLIVVLTALFIRVAWIKAVHGNEYEQAAEQQQILQTDMTIPALRGTIQDTHMGKEYGTITAFVPASTSLDYATELAAATGGRGSLSMRLHHYAPCPEDVDARCPRETVDPLDQSRYILAARHALDSGIFD